MLQWETRIQKRANLRIPIRFQMSYALRHPAIRYRCAIGFCVSFETSQPYLPLSWHHRPDQTVLRSNFRCACAQQPSEIAHTDADYETWLFGQLMNGKGKGRISSSWLRVEQQKRKRTDKYFENITLYCLARVFCGKPGIQEKSQFDWIFF
jgi:hypothetical protein